MNKIYFFLLLIIFFSASVIAAGFSPSSLIFNLNKNEQQCQTVTLINVTEDIQVSNLWALNKDVEWKVSSFQTPATVHGLDLSYTIDDADNGKTVEVCLSGNKAGEYHGAIIFKQAKQGNSILQLAVWLKATIKETSASPNSGSSLTTTTKTKPTYEKLSTAPPTAQPTTPPIQTQKTETNTKPVTVNAPEKTTQANFNWIYLIIPITLIVIAILGGVAYSRRQEKRKQLGYI